MYILYYKEPYIVKEPLTKNRTTQSWRGKQILMCEYLEPLLKYIDKQKDPKKFYIERQPERRK